MIDAQVHGALCLAKLKQQIKLYLSWFTNVKFMGQLNVLSHIVLCLVLPWLAISASYRDFEES